MIEFSRYISDRWGIAEPLAQNLCNSFTKGYSPFYLSDYDLAIASETELSQVCEIFDFLAAIHALAPKKKRTLAALNKVGKPSARLEERIRLSISDAELDDIVAGIRVNPRSPGQVALAKGLGGAANAVLEQRSDLSLKEIAQPLVGSHPSLKTADDVLNGIRDILAERFAADETVRAMVREYGTEKGVLEVIPKSKKDRTYASYVGKLLDIHAIDGKELLALMLAEERKELRLKVSVQLFQITELLREHFITNPDSEAFDLLTSAIDQCWANSLEPVVEKEVKSLLRSHAEEAVTKIIASELTSANFAVHACSNGPCIALGLFDASAMAMVAVTPQGHLLGASSVSLAHPKGGSSPASDRLAQFLSRYRGAELLMLEEQHTPEIESVIKAAANQATVSLNVKRVALQECERSLADSAWIKEKFADLDESMRKTLAIALAYLKPPNLIPQIGVRYFALHPMQSLISPEKMAHFISRMLTERELHNGIPVSSIGSSVLASDAFVSAQLAAELHKPSFGASIASKRDLMNIPGMTEVAFHNIAGYVVVPNADHPLDRTLVHPGHYAWVCDIAEAIGASLEALIADPEIIRSYICDDPLRKIFIEKRLIAQLRAGQKRQGQQIAIVKRRLKLADLVEGSVVSGRVTNITPFGVFVDINAVCDGLVHISQLADAYIESPEQVVAVGDRISARIVKIDVKKRRISLSMKGMGDLAPKIRPTRGQLNSLADHFKNR